jgi:hypothetical protein
MLRTCDGTDPNLVDPAGQPCACGMTFEDVDRAVIWPHQRVLSRAEKQREIDYWADRLHLPPITLADLDAEG